MDFRWTSVRIAPDGDSSTPTPGHSGSRAGLSSAPVQPVDVGVWAGTGSGGESECFADISTAVGYPAAEPRRTFQAWRMAAQARCWRMRAFRMVRHVLSCDHHGHRVVAPERTAAAPRCCGGRHGHSARSTGVSYREAEEGLRTGAE
jgi:hypothetical protein